MKIMNFLKNKNKGILEANKTFLSLDDRLYYYLKKMAVGYEKRVKSGTLMKLFEINDNKILRMHIQNIRQEEKYEKIVCSQAGKKGGYWIANNEEEIKKTLQQLYKRSMEMLKTYSIIRKKANLDKQYKLKFTKNEKELVESIMR